MSFRASLRVVALPSLAPRAGRDVQGGAPGGTHVVTAQWAPVSCPRGPVWLTHPALASCRSTGDTVAMRTLRVQAGPSLCPLQASLVTHTGRGKTLPAPGAELVTVLVTRTLAPGWELTCLTRHSPPGQVHRHK